MKGSSASYSKKRKWLIGALTPVMAVCLAAGLAFLNTTEKLTRTVYAAQGFNNIVNANIGMHPKWIESKCISAKDGGVGDTYTNKHDVWHADVTTKGKNDVGNDVVMEKSPSYVFTGNETNAAELAATYSLKAGNEVVFNITDGDSAAKVWADAVAFAQTLGEATPLADWTLAGQTPSQAHAGGTSNSENHSGFRVGTNTGERNMYKGNFFLKNEDGALGQYIIVRLQDDWTAKDITTTAPTDVQGQDVTKQHSSTNSDYLTGVTGTSTASVNTTSFNYVPTTANTKNVFGKSETYLPTATSEDGFTRIDNNDNDYVISWDLASNSCDYDGAVSGVYGYIYNDTCAFSYGRINVPTGVYIVLDLNGHTINRNLTTANYYGSVFHIDSKARLEIMDSSAYENASAARIEGGDATTGINGTPHTTNHEGTITGGKVSSAANAKLSLPQTLQANLQSNGGGFNLSMWADVVVHSGTISNNQNGSSSGGAFYQRSKAAVTIFDGYVLDNEAVSGGVTNLGSGSGCPFTMYGGVLAYNKATNGNGGAVNLAESSYGNFHGGEIMYNEATGSTTVEQKVVHVTYDGKKPTFYGCGGAICLAGNTLGILDSVTIAHNKAAASGTEKVSDHDYSLGGGGVFVGPAVGAVDKEWKNGDNAFKFRGSLQIHDNTAGGKPDNVHLGYGFVGSGFLPGLVGATLGKDYEGFPKIGIGGEMIANGIVANVGVTIGKYDDAGVEANNVFTSGYGANGNQDVDTFLYFHSDNADYAVKNNGENTSREATLGLASSVQNDNGLTWVIEGTGTDADTVIGEGGGESTLKIVIDSSGNPTFYYKNPSNPNFNTLKKVDNNSQMNNKVPLTEGDPTNKLLDVLKDRFSYSSGSLEFEYSMLKVTKISAYSGTPTFGTSGDTLTVTGGALLRSWESTQTSSGDKPTYQITNTFDNANFHFKLGNEDLTAATNSVSTEMQNAISATDGSISYAGEYSVLVSGARYTNPSFKIKINQVGVQVDRSLYYNGKEIGDGKELEWLKDVDWDGDGTIETATNGGELGEENDQPYFIYTGSYYYPILNADYNRLEIFNLYDPFTKTYSTVSKGQFTGYVLEFTYANQYFGTSKAVQFGSHSGGGIEYQTMHRQPNSGQGIGTYVPGVKNAGMYTVQFISSRSAQSAEQGDADFKATGVYFAANNFAFSSTLNIYVDPATAEVELTSKAQAGFIYNAREIPDTEIVIYDNTSNTHVNPHLDDAATLEYYLFDDLKLKAGIYDMRTKLYYTLDQVASQDAWDKVRPYGRKADVGKDDSAQEKLAKDQGRPYFSSFPDSQLANAPVVKWNSDGTDKFDPTSISSAILEEDGLKQFQALYEKPTDLTSNGRLVYIVDESSFGIGEGKAKKLESNPTDARRYVVFVALDLDVGYDDYNYVFDQDREHLVGLGGDTPYFWAFEFTVNPAEINPSEGQADRKNTEVTLTKDVWYNGDSYGYEYDGKSTFSKPNLSEQANLPTVMYYGNGAGSALTLGDDYEIEYVHFDSSNPDGETTFNYLDASVRLDPTGPAYAGYNFGAYNLAVKIIFGGKNQNYVNKEYETGAADENGTAYEDGDGAFYIYFRICPIVVSASGSLSYTYDGGNFDRARYLPPRTGHGPEDAWYESIFFLVQDGITTPNELIQNQNKFTYTTKDQYEGKTRDLDDLWGGVEGERNGKTYGDTSFYKGRYTLGNIAVAYSNEDFKNHDISFGLGLYSFNTGNANFQSTAYHLTTTAYDEKGKTGDSQDGVGVAPDKEGVTWLLTTTVNSVQTQTFNTAPNFIIDTNKSWLDVTIGQKNISEDFGSIVKFGEKTFDHVSSGSGTPLASEQTGASYPYAGNNWSYVPAVKFEYVPSFSVALEGDASETRYYGFNEIYQHGKTGTGETLKVAQGGKEGVGFSGISLTYTSNGIVSEENGAIVRVTGMGNYTGSFRLTFTITPAKIQASIDPSSKADEVRYDMQPHAPKINYTNVEAYTTYLTGNDGYDGALLQYTGSGSAGNFTAPKPGDAGYQAPTIEYRSLRTAYEGADDDWTTEQPVAAKQYKIRVSTTSSDFVFADTSEFDHTLPTGETENERTVYGNHTILPAIVSVLPTESTVTYNGKAQTPKFDFTNASVKYVIPHDGDYSIDKYLLVDGGAYTYDAAAAPTDAGKYTVTIALKETALGKGKYSNFAFDGGVYTTTITFTIKAAEVGVSVEKEATYNGETQKPTVTFSNGEGGNDAVPKSGEYEITYEGAKLGSDLSPKNAGEYTVTVKLIGNGARNFTLAEGDGEHTFTIVPATVIPFLTENGEKMSLTIAFDNEKHKAGVDFTSNTDAKPDAGAYTLAYSYAGWKPLNEGDDDAYKNAGQYTVAVTLTDGGNFCFSGTAGSYVYTQNLSYNIGFHTLTKEDLVFVEKDGAPIYGLQKAKDSVIVGLSGSDEAPIVYTGAMIEPIQGLRITGSDGEKHPLVKNSDYTIAYTDRIAAGECQVTITGMHNFNGGLELSFTISPKSLGTSKEGAGNYNKENNGDKIFCDPVTTYVFSGSAQSVAVNMTYESTEKTNTLAQYTDYIFLKAYFGGEEKDFASGIVEAGTYTVLIQGQGNYEGIYVLEVEVLPAGITARAKTESFTYDGNPHLSGVIFIAGAGTAKPTDVDWTNANDLFKPQGDNTWVYTNDEYKLTISDVTGYKPFVSGAFASGDEFRNAGTYTVTVEFLEGKDFVFANPTGENPRVMSYTFTITPAVITVSGFESKTYNGKEQGVDITKDTFTAISALTDVDILDLLTTKNGFNAEQITYGLEGNAKPTDAARYTVTVPLKQGGNFAFSRTSATEYVYSTTASFTIETFDISTLRDEDITIDSCTHTGVELTPDVTVTFTLGDESHTLALTSEFTVSYVNNVNASNAARAVLVGTGNFSGSKTKNFTIGKKDISEGEADEEISAELTRTTEYNGTAYSPNLQIRYTPASVQSQVNILVLGDSLNADCTIAYYKEGGSSLDGAPKDAGKYYILVTAKDGNYTGSFHIDFTITPTTLTLTLIGSAQYVYTGISNMPGVLVLSGNTASPVRDVDYTVAEPTYKNDSGTEADHKNYTNAGTYTITVTISSGNYIFESGGKAASVSYRILPARLQVSLNETSAAYSGAGHDLKDKIAFVNLDGSVIPSASEYSIGYAVKDGKGALGGSFPLTLGNYTVTVTLHKDGNFIFDAEGYDTTKPDTYVPSAYVLSKDLDYAIGQMNTTVELAHYSLIYNTEGQKQEPVFGTAVITSDDYTVTYEYSPLGRDAFVSATDFANAGKYRVTVTLQKRDGYDQPFFKLVAGAVGTVTEGTSWTVIYTIEQASVRIELTKSSDTYNGTDFDLRNEGFFTFTNLNGNSTVVPGYTADEHNGFEVSYNSGLGAPLHAGAYSVTVTLGDNFKHEGNNNFTFTITPATVNAGLYEAGDESKRPTEWTEKTSMSYDGSVHEMVDLVSILFTDTVNGDPKGIYKGQAEPDDIRDYSVQYNGKDFSGQFAAAGTYTITVSLTRNGDFSFGSDGSYIYQKTLTFIIDPLNIEDDDVRLELMVTGDDHYYTGSAIILSESEVQVYLIHRHKVGENWVDYTDDDSTPAEKKPVLLGKDQYILTYAGNVDAGEAEVIVIGQNGISGQDHATFTIKPKPLGTQGAGDSWTMDAEFSIENLGILLQSINIFYYNGTSVSLAPSIVYEPASLSKFTLQTSDYTLSWKTKDGSAWTEVSSSTPQDAGEYILRVTAASKNYADKFDVGFRILPAVIKAELNGGDNYYTGEGQRATINFYYLSEDPTLNNTPIPSDYVAHDVSYTGADLAAGLPINAGSYIVTITLTEACKNFVFSYGAGGLPDAAVGRTHILTSQFEIKRALVMAALSTSSVTYTGKEIDCTPYIEITPVSGGSESEVWKSAIADFSLLYFNKDGTSSSLPLAVAEYSITVKLNNGNLEFFTHDEHDDKVSLPLAFSVSRANLSAKVDGEFDNGRTDESINGQEFNLKVTDRMEDENIIYDPADPVVFEITAKDAFNLFRTEDEVTINYSVRAGGNSAFEYTGNGVKFSGSGEFTVDVEVTSANYETAKFTVHVKIVAKDITITVNGVISSTYGDSDLEDGEALLNAFLNIVTGIEGVPGNVTELEGRKEWLRTYGLNVFVEDSGARSTAGKRKAGSYNLKITLALADNKVSFAKAQPGDASVSQDGLYEVKQKEVALMWDLLDREYDATSHYNELLYQEDDRAQLSDVFHTAVLGDDAVSFASYTISQYNSATKTWDAIIETAFALRNVGKYKITVGKELSGADSENYSFSGAEKEFEITRMVVAINVADARVAYGEDFKTALTFTFDNDVNFETVLSRDSFDREKVENFLKELIVLQAQVGGNVYDGVSVLPPVGQYDIKFGADSGADADGRTLNDEGTYFNYRFVLYGHYSSSDYATLTVFSANVTVILKDSDVALEIGYGEKYSASLSGNYTEDEKFPLTGRLFEYIFGDIKDPIGSERRVRNIVGLEEVYPTATWEELANYITENCWFEVVDPKISAGGYLMAGTYDIKILAKEGCGFSVSFPSNHSGTSTGIGQSGANRLVISPKTLEIDWATPDDDVSVSGGKIRAIYTSLAYGNKPFFANVNEDDDVGVPVFHFTDLGGATLTEGPVNVGNYSIYIDGIAAGGADNSCYVLPENLSTGLEIVPRRLTVNVHNGTSVYGNGFEDLTYDVSWDWAHRGDTVADLNITLTKASGTDAGSYDITGAWNNANYDLTFTEATYEITQREIVVRMDDLSSYYGEAFKDFTFTWVEGSFAPDETLADLRIVGAKAEGTDAAEYVISGTDVDPNYNITVLPGKYTIEQAENAWDGEFSFRGWGAGYTPKTPELPGSKFGDIEVRYYYDEACTQEIEDLAALPEGEYFIRLTVAETGNYTGLSETYAFSVEHVVEATLYVILFGSQFVILTAALIFIRKKKSGGDKE